MLRLKKKSRGRNKIFSSKHLKISIKAVTVLLSVKKILFLWKNRWDIRFFRAYLESRSRGLRDNVDRLWERLTRGSWWFNETRFTRFSGKRGCYSNQPFLDTRFDESVLRYNARVCWSRKRNIDFTTSCTFIHPTWNGIGEIYRVKYILLIKQNREKNILFISNPSIIYTNSFHDLTIK